MITDPISIHAKQMQRWAEPFSAVTCVQHQTRFHHPDEAKSWPVLVLFWSRLPVGRPRARSPAAPQPTELVMWDWCQMLLSSRPFLPAAIKVTISARLARRLRAAVKSPTAAGTNDHAMRIYDAAQQVSLVPTGHKHPGRIRGDNLYGNQR